ncbi:hypothetical protein D6821_00160 [Candidatus Parcubacteria bacterium]|nr:MAG: hypothetical protein D6821_00160 [Candidatus Parcubacteria bacterium]
MLAPLIVLFVYNFFICKIIYKDMPYIKIKKILLFCVIGGSMFLVGCGKTPPSSVADDSQKVSSESSSPSVVSQEANLNKRQMDVASTSSSPLLDCQQSDEKEKNKCLRQNNLISAVNSLSEKSCKDLAEGDRQQCLDLQTTLRAAQQKRVDQCSQIIDSARQQACRNQVYFSLAIKERNSQYCEKISSPKDQISCRRLVFDLTQKANNKD